ncbi:uncharacterized protein [Musca autumnalis]|uniref:uncharacterized protein n=1 Tax=Musca autumnalis TaxID=221902 RepID=UPI003CEABA15
MSQTVQKMPPKTHQSIMQYLMEMNSKLDRLTEKVTYLQLKVDKLCVDNNNILQKEIKDVKDQTSVVLDVLAENTTAIKNNLKNSTPKFADSFPIKTLEQFTSWERTIDERNEKEYVCMRL